MKAVRIYEEGGPEVLKLEDLPVPEPGGGEALVRVYAAAVGFADVLRRSGGYPVPTTFPAILGSRAAGIVEKVGVGVDGALVGKTVVGQLSSGSYAEYGTAKVKDIDLLPDGVDPVDALAILSDADVAGMALKVRGRIEPGESVFVPAATGGIGFVAVQLAQLYGAGRVFGGASSEAKRAMVADLGARPIDYTKEGWPDEVIRLNGGNGVDLSLEVNGGQYVYDTLKATRPGGRMVNYGNVSDTNAPVNPRQLLQRNQTLIGFSRSGTARDGLWPKEHEAINQEIMSFIVSGQLRPLIGGRYRLEETAEAHRALENRSTVGKVMLIPGE